MDALHPEVNHDAYLRRMAQVGDKALLKPEDLPPDARVLDYGCADGSLSLLFAPEQYLGYDLSEIMVQEAVKAHPGYQFTAVEPAERFHLVILSSVLHEVYSYNSYSFLAVSNLLEHLRGLLLPGGRIIIRDGVNALENPLERLSLSLRDPEDASRFITALGRNSPLHWRVRVKDGHLEGTASDILHFLNVYTWGWDSLPRESKERVNFANLKEWEGLLRLSRYEVVEECLITQEPYFTHLEDLVDLQGRRWPTKILLTLTSKNS